MWCWSSVWPHRAILHQCDVDPVCGPIELSSTQCGVGPVCGPIELSSTQCDVDPVCVPIELSSTQCDVDPMCVPIELSSTQCDVDPVWVPIAPLSTCLCCDMQDSSPSSNRHRTLCNAVFWASYCLRPWSASWRTTVLYAHTYTQHHSHSVVTDCPLTLVGIN